MQINNIKNKLYYDLRLLHICINYMDLLYRFISIDININLILIL